MSKDSDHLTAAQAILVASGDLDRQGHTEFSEWDLTVATWKRDPNRFGCRGYENQYPDHKRVMMEIMGTTKKDNPIRRGWFVRSRPNHYKLTDVGRVEIDKLNSVGADHAESRRSPQLVYDAVAPFYRNAAFKKFLKDPEEPRMWLAAASFLGLTSNEAQHVQDRKQTAKAAISDALSWMEAAGVSEFHRGVSGGQEAFSKSVLTKLQEFLAVIDQRFAAQFEAIQGSKSR